MQGSVLRIRVFETGIQRQQVHVVHANVVVSPPFGEQESYVDQGSPVEAIPVHLIQHEDVVGNPLSIQEVTHVGCELQQLLEPISKRHNYS